MHTECSVEISMEAARLRVLAPILLLGCAKSQQCVPPPHSWMMLYLLGGRRLSASWIMCWLWLGFRCSELLKFL